MNPNIVEAEFSLVGGSMIDSPQALLTEIQERRTAGAIIKFTVRFCDDDGFVTKFVKAVEPIRAREKGLRKEVFTAQTHWKQLLLDFRHRRVVGKLISLKSKALNVAVKQLRAVAETSGEIALECPDRSFRPLRANETHELLERADRATGVRILLFKPNILIADKLKSVAYLM